MQIKCYLYKNLTVKHSKQMNSFILIQGILSRLCMKHGTSLSAGKTWIDIPCTTIHKFSFVRHAS